MIVRTLIAASLLAGPAVAQEQKTSQEPPKRVRSVILYGSEQCPKASDPDEVVVCANAGESPYRIPKALRDQPDESAAAGAWTRRVETVEEFNRAGLPNSCSPVGTGGQTGCSRAAIQQWAQERLNAKVKASRVP